MVSRLKIKVKYLLWLAEKAGTSEEEVDLPEDSTLVTLIEKLCENKSSKITEILGKILQGDSEIIILHNSKTPTNGLKTLLKDGDAVIFIPPVSGGSD